MRVLFAMMASLVPFIHASNSITDYIRGLPLELRDRIFQYLTLNELVILNSELRKKHSDIVPSDYIKKEAIYKKAEICGKPVISGYWGSDIFCGDVTIAIHNFYLQFAPSNDLSSFENFLLGLTLEFDNKVFIGVVRAIIASSILTNTLLRLSPDTYSKVMPPLIQVLENNPFRFSIDHIITDQFILNHPALFHSYSKFTARTLKFIDYILDKDNVEACQVLLTRPDAKYIISQLREKMINGRAHDAAVVILSHKVRRRFEEGYHVTKVIEVVEKIGSERLDIFKEIFIRTKDILPPTAAKDILCKALKEGHPFLVTAMIRSKKFNLVIDFDIILKAWWSFKTHGSRLIYNQMGPCHSSFDSQSPFHDIFNEIFERGLLQGVDLSYNDNILLSEAINFNYVPLIERLINDPKVRAVGLTKNMIDGIVQGVLTMYFDTADMIVRVFGVNSNGIDVHSWRPITGYAAYKRIPLILAALGVSLEENINDNGESEDELVFSECPEG